MKDEQSDPSFPQLLHLTRITAAVAVRNEPALRRELKAAFRAKISVATIREVILQSYLFAGYAATINAFVLLNALVSSGAQEFLSERAASVSKWRKRGTALCKIIYGRQYEKLVRNMSDLHPDLADWMIVEGYGKVLARPFLSARVRELLIVATTAVLQVERQFHSHVRGALHTGSTANELRSVLSSVRAYMPAASLKHYRKLLEDII